MKLSKNVVLGSFVAGAITLGVLGANVTAEAAWWWPFGNSTADAAKATSGKTYDATFYVAGMGGHFAKAVATIDPSKDQPIIVHELTKIDIGARPDHPTHDARIDAGDRNTMFWSTYKIDKEVNGVHVGKTDLRTGEIIQDMVVDVPAEATNTKSMYCASGQDKDHFIPLSMTSKAYIDVFNKSDLKRVQRVFLEGTEGAFGVPYKFYHGNNSNDMKKLLVIANEADKDHGKTFGKVHLVELDMAKFVNGEVKVLNRGVIAGTPKSITFRAYYSP